MGGDATYRVVTDPSEGPKAFTIQTRVTSRGELAVIMMGVDCAERIMLHESVGFDLPEDAFVFKLGPGTAGVLDQLLAQGALKISRVIDLGHGGRPAPLCALTPGGAPQPAFEGAAGANAAHAAAATAATSAASSDAFFDALRMEEKQVSSMAGGDPRFGGSGGMPAQQQQQQQGFRGAPPGMRLGPPPPHTQSQSQSRTAPPPAAGGAAGLMAMLGVGGAGGAGGGSPANPSPPVARHLMPRTTSGSAGGGSRIRGGGEGSADDRFFDASDGSRRSPASMTHSLHSSTGSLNEQRAPSPMGGGASGIFAGGGDPLAAFFGGAGAGSSPGPPPGMGPPMPGAGLMGALSGDNGGVMPARSPLGSAPPGTAPSGDDLLAMLGGGGGGGGGAPPMPPMPGGPGAMLSAADLEARAMARTSDRTSDKRKGKASKPTSGGTSGDDLMTMLSNGATSRLVSGPPVPPMPTSANYVATDRDDGVDDTLGGDGALGLGFLGITGIDDFDLPPAAGETGGEKKEKKEKESKKQKEKDKKKKDDKKKDEKPPAADEGEWPWSAGFEHREKERDAAAATADAETAAALREAVKTGADRLEPLVGKKSAYKATSGLDAPLPEDNVGRRLLKKQGWTPLVDPATGVVVDEAPVPIPTLAGVPARAGLGSTARASTKPAAEDVDADDANNKQAKVMAMVGEAKGAASRPSSIGRGKSDASADSGGGSGSGASGLGLSYLGITGGSDDEDEWAEEEDEKTPKAAAAVEVKVDAKDETTRADPESWEDVASPTPTKPAKTTYTVDELKSFNVGCDAKPAGADLDVFDGADKVAAAAAEKARVLEAKLEKEKKEKERAEKKEKEKADKAEKAAKARAEKEAKANAEKEAKDAAKAAVAKSRSTDSLDGPAIGGALGLGFLGIAAAETAADDDDDEETTAAAAKTPEPEPFAAERSTTPPPATPTGMTVRELAAALMAELRGLEDRVEVLGEEEGPLVALRLGAALEAIRDAPFKSI